MFEPRPAPPPPADAAPPPLVNPRPRVQIVPIYGDNVCVIVDDFVAEPERMVEFAKTHRSRFADSAENYYPGPELALHGRFLDTLTQAYVEYARAPLKARRVHHVTSRLSLVTRRPEELSPGQRLPHTDAFNLPRNEGRSAMVLYLFHDARLGGTSFFRPTRPEDEISAVLREAKRMDTASATRLLDAESTYAIASTRYFDKVLTVEPKWNRAIFYSGTLFHSGSITAPELLTDDPLTGRLTINAFFDVRMAAG